MAACKNCSTELPADCGQVICESCLEKQGKLHAVKPVTPGGRCGRFAEAIKNGAVGESEVSSAWVIAARLGSFKSSINYCPFCGVRLYDDGRKTH